MECFPLNILNYNCVYIQEGELGDMIKCYNLHFAIIVYIFTVIKNHLKLFYKLDSRIDSDSFSPFSESFPKSR